MPKYCCVIQNS